jgi:uncharacterized protein YciU (UPF0263 family)
MRNLNNLWDDDTLEGRFDILLDHYEHQRVETAKVIYLNFSARERERFENYCSDERNSPRVAMEIKTQFSSYPKK